MTILFFSGLTALDFILDFDEWIECGYFSDEIRARLKGKHFLFQIFKRNIKIKLSLIRNIKLIWPCEIFTKTLTENACFGIQ